MLVKNCPAYYKNLGCMGNKMFFKSCELEDNCTIKQLLNMINNEEINKLLGVEELE